MSNIADTLDAFPCLSRSVLPTPFHRLGNLSNELGINLWCKRDDMTAFGFGGNKTRKLDYLIAEALQQGATDLIAAGAVQSNFCRMTAAYASAEGLGCTLVLGGTSQRKHTGNHLLDELFGAECTYIDSDNWDDRMEAAQRVYAYYASMNRIPYLMPIGGSTPTGALGYVQGFLELYNDIQRESIQPDCIYHATSSCGTHAGLLVGQAAKGWEGEIRAIVVAKNTEQLTEETVTLAEQTAKRLGLKPGKIPLYIDDTHIGKAYAVDTEEAIEAQRLFARREGIVLDTVYTAKAAAAVIADARNGRIPKGASVVFIHTGGSPEVFV